MENIKVSGNIANQTAELGVLGCINTINKDVTRIVFTAAYTVTFVIAVVGNSLTIHIVRTYKDMIKVGEICLESRTYDTCRNVY